MKNGSDEDDENMIALEGCGISTKWRFPKDLTKCPMLRCDASFSTHSACRNHFKKVHAKHSICCPECKKPYVAFRPHNFLLHFSNAHPNSRMPFKFNQATKDDDEKSKNNTDDNVITLNALGLPTNWRVPADMLKCPVQTCQRTFKERSSFISHYTTNHAAGSIFCEMCDKPLRISSPKDLVKHFEKLHPNHKMPFDLGVGKRNRNKKIIHLKQMVCIA